MLHMMKHKPVMLGTTLLMVAMAMAQSQREREALSVQSYPGQASVIRYQGRVFVDAQALAQITNGSLSFEEQNNSDAAWSGRFIVERRCSHIRLLAPLHEGSDRGNGVDQRVGWNSAGDRPEWVSSRKYHGRKHDHGVPGSSCRQRRNSFSGGIDRL